MTRILLSYIVALALGVMSMAAPRMVRGRPVVWEPNPGPQSAFLSSGAYEVLYGGAAGGGKSDGLLVGALYDAHHPQYSAVIFRRTFADLQRTLIERAYTLIPAADPGADYNESKHLWRFSSGARLQFAHLEHEKDKFDHQGAEYQYIGFDELTHFTRSQYTYMLSRARSAAGLRIQIRATANPGGEGHEWVFQRFDPWLDPQCATKADPNQVLWYRHDTDGKEQYCDKGTPGALSRVFIPARLADNPKLCENDPGYADRLDALDPVTRAQLRDGNWLIKPAAGLLFKRGWFELVDAVPADAQRIRYWDRAATVPSKENPDPDWTRGMRLARANGVTYIEDVVSCRDTPGAVEQLVLQTAKLDGKAVRVGIEQDPGQAGKFEASSYIRLLEGYDVRAYPATKSKVVRAQPVSAQAEAKNVKLLRRPWNEALLAELEAFPDAAWHDDQVDALSGGYAALLDTPVIADPIIDTGGASPNYWGV